MDAVRTSCAGVVDAFASIAGVVATLSSWGQQEVQQEADAALASQLQAQEDSGTPATATEELGDDGGGKDPVAAVAVRNRERDMGLLSDDGIMDSTVNPNAIAESPTKSTPTIPTPHQLNPPAKPGAKGDAEIILEDWDNASDESDVSWTESADEESDCGDDEEYLNQWRESDNEFKYLSINFNVTDKMKEEGYFTEARKVALNFLKEFKAVSLTTKTKSKLNENEVLNTIAPTSILVPIIEFMNRNLLENDLQPMRFPEFEPYLRSFFWLCFYQCSLADIRLHPEAYPKVVAEINRLMGDSFDEKVDRLNHLLRSFNGHEVKAGVKSSGDNTLHFQEVYGHDYELEKMLRDVGGHASKLAFIRGVSSLLIDDEKMQSRSAKTNDISLSKFESA